MSLNTYLVVVIIAISVAFAGAELEGPNVCENLRNHTKTVPIIVKEAYQVQESRWCWAVPPRCSVNRQKFQTVRKTENITREQMTKECCEGYQPTAAGDRCVPICHKKCICETCLNPDNCTCVSANNDICTSPRRCKPGRYGKNCDKNCTCDVDRADCSSANGTCSCKSGWTGEKCEKRCPDGKIGDQCRDDCPKGLYGSGCLKKCNCKNEKFKCDTIEGCICKPEYTYMDSDCETIYRAHNIPKLTQQ